jgi:hypothetical protein
MNSRRRILISRACSGEPIAVEVPWEPEPFGVDGRRLPGDDDAARPGDLRHRDEPLGRAIQDRSTPAAPPEPPSGLLQAILAALTRPCQSGQSG